MDKFLQELICDRMEGWELVEFLQISTEDICEAFKDQIEEAIDDVREFCGLRTEEYDGD